MAQTHVERELKFNAPADVALPSLVDVVVNGTEGRTEALRLRAVYYDTADRHLQRHGATLRRRSGGNDAGWHLKLPVDDDTRLEIYVESSASRVPRELADLVKGIRLAQRLEATARLETRRVRHEILDESGELVAEVADDDVLATPLLGPHEPSSWREVEVELGPAGDETTLKAVRKALKRAGFQPSEHGSKYARAVGDPPAAERLPRLAGLVDDYLQQQYRALGEQDAHLRLGENRVHKMRVAVRRIRSTVRVFGDLFDGASGAALDRELRWFAEILGRARDLDIVRGRVTARVADLAPELVLGPVAADAESSLSQDRADAGSEVESAMNGRRYQSLLQTLDAWRTQPPRTAVDPKPSAAAKYVKTAGATTHNRLKSAITSGVIDDYHLARKAAKRYRYAAELAEPRLGQPAAVIVADAARLQDVLGELQDAVASAAVLLDLAARVGGRVRHNAFAFGVMHAQEQAAADEIRRALAKTYR
jgi:CHAD domain-containing protein